MRLNVPRLSLFLLLAASPLLFGDSSSTKNINQGGPAVEKRNFTNTEIERTLRLLGADPATAGPISCFISDTTGKQVTQITASSLGGPFYWFNYTSAGVSSKSVQFEAVPMFTGSPVADQKQLLQPNSSTNILTPFGIPFWNANLTSGPWVLVVHNDSGQHATCNFTVVP
jgi:hypothetical protein